jgi:hypothetical protein
MAAPYFQRTVVNSQGDVQAGASVEVRNEANNELAAIYTDRALTSAKANPFTTDENGLAEFFVARGEYKITATAGGGSIIWRYVQMIDTDFVASTDTAQTLTNKTITFADNTLTGVQPALGFTPLNKAGDTMTGALTVTDSLFTIQDNLDNTKKAQFDLSSITAGTNRTYTLPNINGTLAFSSNNAQTFSGNTTFSNATVTVGTATGASTYGLATGATTTGLTKAVNIGTAGLSGSTTNIAIGSAVAGATTNVTASGTWTYDNTIVGSINGNAAGITGKTTPTGELVGTTDTQTLTNKTAERIILNDGYTEEVFAITDDTTVNLDPNNGSIQTWTLGANRTPDQANWAAGQSITLMIDDGTARTITWTTLAVVWETNGGTAPTLALTGFTVIVLWKVGSTIYGARVGDA